MWLYRLLTLLACSFLLGGSALAQAPPLPIPQPLPSGERTFDLSGLDQSGNQVDSEITVTATSDGAVDSFTDGDGVPCTWDSTSNTYEGMNGSILVQYLFYNDGTYKKYEDGVLVEAGGYSPGA